MERRFGWDTHGLPVEYEIDKKLGIKVMISTKSTKLKRFIFPLFYLLLIFLEINDMEGIRLKSSLLK